MGCKNKSKMKENAKFKDNVLQKRYVNTENK